MTIDTKTPCPIILFRGSLSEEGERAAAERHFKITDSRVNLRDSLVIGRYSVLPFYKELEHDLELQESCLINSYQAHNYIANFDYYEDLKDFTPESWIGLEDVPKTGCTYVLKGRTNSRKSEWNTKMFAASYEEAVDLYCELQKDPLIGDQGVIIRRYIPLKTLEIGLHGLPFSNEWRFFYHKTTLLAHGFYWAAATEARGEMTFAGLAFADRCAAILANHIDFFVIDIAETQDGGWIMIEANDGQMSGLGPDIDPDKLYGNLSKALRPSMK